MKSYDQQPLSCRDVISLFGDYVDDELDSSTRENVTLHIATCPSCQEFEGSFRFTIEAAAALGREEVPMPLGAKNRLRTTLNERLGLSLPLLGDA